MTMQNYRPIFTEFGVKMAHVPWKKPLDFGGNLDKILRYGYNYS